MLIRIALIAFGIVVGLFIGYAIGYRDGVDESQTQIFMLNEQIRTVPKQYQ